MQTSYSPQFFVEGDLFWMLLLLQQLLNTKNAKKETKLWANNLHGVDIGQLGEYPKNNYKKREKHARGKTIVTKNKEKITYKTDQAQITVIKRH